MDQKPEGTYLLTNVGFSKEKPTLVLLRDGEFTLFHPLGNTLTLTADTSQRFCCGWRDIAAGISYPCPQEDSRLDDKYEQCAQCQQKTGFNPAFYNAAQVSPQQEQRNKEPHLLYIAHFGPGVLKVGISHAARGIGRLLEQGARTAVILETFPSAHIARQYEARISAQPGIVEAIALNKKIATLSHNYDTNQATLELQQTVALIESTLSVTFAQQRHLDLSAYYFTDSAPLAQFLHDQTHAASISGKVTGMIGSILFSQYDEKTTLFLPMKKYVGYRVTITDSVSQVAVKAKQASLFDF